MRAYRPGRPGSATEIQSITTAETHSTAHGKIIGCRQPKQKETAGTSSAIDSRYNACMFRGEWRGGTGDAHLYVCTHKHTHVVYVCVRVWSKTGGTPYHRGRPAWVCGLAAMMQGSDAFSATSSGWTGAPLQPSPRQGQSPYEGDDSEQSFPARPCCFTRHPSRCLRLLCISREGGGGAPSCACPPPP